MLHRHPFLRAIRWCCGKSSADAGAVVPGCRLNENIGEGRSLQHLPIVFRVQCYTPGQAQGIKAGGYDIVIAANVLHATKNIRQTLRNAKAALKKNGLLLLLELSSKSLFHHLTSGLLRGWWLYRDQGLRIPGCPALFPKTWQEVLEIEGFGSVSFPAQESHDLGYQVIVAQSDGVVRQPHRIESSTQPPGHAVMQPCSRAAMQYHPHSPSSDMTLKELKDHMEEVIIEKLSKSLKVVLKNRSQLLT